MREKPRQHIHGYVHRSRREGIIIDSDTEIELLHASLASRFQDFRMERPDTPLYLLEHGLEGGDLEQLMTVVRSSLVRHRVDDRWWGVHALPLLVATTEIGYNYRGTGTDFWPIFKDRLGDLALGQRATLTALFRRWAAKLYLAEPPDSSWNLAFCHIAWSIQHAVLPIELHQPLTRALRDVRSHLDLNASDTVLIEPIRIRAQLAGGVRLQGWLEDSRTAAAVIRQILHPDGQHGLASSALKRIVADLARNETASIALREARRRQNALETRPKLRPRNRLELEPKLALLVLRIVEQRLVFALKIPQMEQGARERARSVLETIRWRAFLWGDGRPVPGRNIFSDFPLLLQIDKLPGMDVSLLGDVNSLPLAQEAKDFLGSLRVASAAPLLFSDFADDGDAHQRSSNSVNNSGYCIVLVMPGSVAPSSAEYLGQVAALYAYRLDVTDLPSQDWLTSLGFAIRQITRITWIGDPEIEQHRPVRRFAKGSFIAFELSSPGGLCEVRLTEPDGKVSVLDGEDSLLAGFVAAATGVYKIRYSAGEELVLEVIERQDDLELIRVDIDASSGTTADLADQKVTLRFDSLAAIQEAEFELKLRCDGRVVKRVREILPDTPCRLTSDHPIWSHLLDRDTVEQLLAASHADLGVSVPGLLETWFGFEKVTAPFAWERQSGGQLTATDESGALSVFSASSQSPLTLARVESTSIEDDIQLFRAGHDLPLQGGGYCIGPRIWRTGDREAAPKPKRLLRQFDGARERMADGRGVVDALIGWAAAGVDHPVTQFRRGQIMRQIESWMVEQLCGVGWAEQEAALSGRQGQNFVSGFLSACTQLQIGYCDVGLSRAQRALLDRIVARLIETRALPIILETSYEPIEEGLSIALDDLFNDAYALLCEEIKSVGDHCPFSPDDDIDIGEVSENWDQAFRAAASEAALIELVGLLRPLDAGDMLSRADFEGMLPDEVVDLLYEWIAKHQPAHHARQWSRDLVESAYWLFARPAVAARLSWRAATERLLADRFSARAIRYAALRAHRTVGAQ